MVFLKTYRDRPQGSAPVRAIDNSKNRTRLRSPGKPNILTMEGTVVRVRLRYPTRTPGREVRLHLVHRWFCTNIALPRCRRRLHTMKAGCAEADRVRCPTKFAVESLPGLLAEKGPEKRGQPSRRGRSDLPPPAQRRLNQPAPFSTSRRSTLSSHGKYFEAPLNADWGPSWARQTEVGISSAFRNKNLSGGFIRPPFGE
jgi:hypothetical protein